MAVLHLLRTDHYYHQQYLHKVPWGYCPDHGTGVACPVDFTARVKLQG